MIPKGAFGYIQGGGDEWTLRRNRAAFDDKQILLRMLANVEAPDTATSLLGDKNTGADDDGTFFIA